MRWLPIALVLLLGAAPPSRTRVLYVGAGRTLPRALERDFDVTVRRHQPASLATYDVVIVSNVAAHLLDAAALDAYVKAGGTLIMAGGADSFGTGAYQATPLEKLLPVRFDSENRCSRPELALVLVVDRYRGSTIASATRVASEALAPNDYISVIAFDSEPRIVVRPQRAAHRAQISEAASRIEASDTGSNVHAALGEAFEILASINATSKRVIVISDAHAPGDLVAEMEKEGIIVSSGTERDLPALIADARRPRDEDPVHVRGAFVKAPPITSYVTTAAKPASDVLLASVGFDEPILARWCYGAGASVVWTGDVDEWATWDGYAAFWSKVVLSSRFACTRTRDRAR